MKQFRLLDNILGWVTFLIAAFVYCSTIEPTASFWDCPEFISTGYKLEVGHPPGAPFFMLTANLFSHFASDPSQVARMVNTMSALLSAVTILFLFWSISHLVRRLLVKDWSELTPAKTIAIEGSALVGALIYTFSDTFWFSAVEGEVYAYSSAFTALVFWLILKWEEHADEPHSDRWLVLIMYMTGLSIGVHLLNLLCLPAIVLVYYYRKCPQPDSRKDLYGSIAALVISVVILGAVLYGLVPGIVRVGGWFELLFVNVFGCPFNTGEIVYIILLIATLVWAIYESYKDQSLKRQNIAFLLSVAMLGIPFFGYGWSAVLIGIVVLALIWLVLQYKRQGKLLITSRIKNTSLLCMMMLLIGYSSYAVIVIRSAANPPMDQNSPEDIFTLGDYLARDQYGQRPLLYGQAYTSQVALEKAGDYCRPVSTKGAPVWQRKEKASADEKDEYFVARTKDDYVYAQNMLFPRMWDSGKAASYRSWLGEEPDGSEEAYDRCGEMVTVKMPSMLQNIRFFLSYQCNFMYWRYFMWNFAGRQNDIQGQGELEHGNWISGFSWLDNWRLGDQSTLPDELKNNKGHNVFYMMPLMLGLIGLFWQSWYTRKRRVPGSDKEDIEPVGIRQFWVVFFLFFMTGLAIVIYLNQNPEQVRERDYAYAGSFYAFAIWCGMGVAALIDLLNRKLKKENVLAAAVIAVVALAVPIQMGSQTWDDHDRSGRYSCRDFGQNYLMSLQNEGNPIIYTNGDNDTFPLWYNQDVEGVRTDARVCNLSYLQTDWYIDQMRRPAYTSPGIPIKWNRLEYVTGTNEYVPIDPHMKQAVLDFYKQDPETAKAQFGDDPFELKNVLKYWARSKNSELHVIPTDTLYMTIDKEAVRKSGMMMASDSIPDRMVISLAGKSALYKGDLMILEMLAECNWKRPIYVAATVGESSYINLGNNVVTEGLAYRITPFTTNAQGTRNFDTKRTYDNVMHRFKFGGLNQKGIYIDETVMRMCYSHRRIMSQLANKLIEEGDKKRAAEVLAYIDKMLPSYNIPHEFSSGSLDIAEGWYQVGQKQKAIKVLNEMWRNSQQYLNWYNNLNAEQFAFSKNNAYAHAYYLQQILLVAQQIDQQWFNKHYEQYSRMIRTFEERGGAQGIDR